MIEKAIMVAAVSLAIVFGANAVGGKLSGTFNEVHCAFNVVCTDTQK